MPETLNISQAIGTTTRTLAIDPMHTLHLGAYRACCWAALWACVLADIFGVGGTNAEVRSQLTVERIRIDLMDWYRRRAVDHPDEPLQRLQTLSLSMLGGPEKVSLSTKAAETTSLMIYCVDLVRGHVLALGARGAPLL